ncbi:hypothetical protein P3T76_006880 [Phytophthora citrophthora]|uniref:Ty3 transposon capsid-like protein domain-containing protein n=1 Tax=Phytophthora citrophthora TaxID=4793 RepID=A0AAD9GNQ4_9STRA|nr:hypothetical protein P3T76_006880 [Phytophthora citrophthora]
MYEGKYGEDIELWIFATEQYYASRRELMEADSSDFVTMISSNLGKSVLNWYRAFIADCERLQVHPTWPLFKRQLRTRFRPKDFEYDLRERMFRLKQRENIHDYVSKFQDLLSQTELSISEVEKRFFLQNGLREETARKIKEERPSTLQDAIEIASNLLFKSTSPQDLDRSADAASSDPTPTRLRLRFRFRPRLSSSRPPTTASSVWLASQDRHSTCSRVGTGLSAGVERVQ